MIKLPRPLLPLALGALLTLALTSCSSLVQRLDVIGAGSAASFDAALRAAPENVAPDERHGGWSLSAPDGSARFIWSEDYSKSPLYDVMLEFDAAPFLDAGLDPDKLPAGVVYSDGKLITGTKLGDIEPRYQGEATPLSSYEQIVRLYGGAVGYHAALDHYGVSLGGGNLFEWAKDLSANDKDIVFALAPEPWIAAGVDPSAVAGWTLAQVTVHANGKPAEVDKLLKPFDLA